MDLKTLGALFGILALVVSGIYALISDVQTQRREGDARLHERVDRVEERVWKLNTPDIDAEPYPE